MTLIGRRWHEPGRLTTFDVGRLSQSYYQSDRKNVMIELFDELIDQMSHWGESWMSAAAMEQVQLHYWRRQIGSSGSWKLMPSMR